MNYVSGRVDFDKSVIKIIRDFSQLTGNNTTV